MGLVCVALTILAVSRAFTFLARCVYLRFTQDKMVQISRRNPITCYLLFRSTEKQGEKKAEKIPSTFLMEVTQGNNLVRNKLTKMMEKREASAQGKDREHEEDESI